MAPLICGTCIVHKEKGINSFSDWLLQGLVIRPSSSLAALHIKELLKRKGNLGKVFFFKPSNNVSSIRNTQELKKKKVLDHPENRGRILSTLAKAGHPLTCPRDQGPVLPVSLEAVMFSVHL